MPEHAVCIVIPRLDTTVLIRLLRLLTTQVVLVGHGVAHRARRSYDVAHQVVPVPGGLEHCVDRGYAPSRRIVLVGLRRGCSSIAGGGIGGIIPDEPVEHD